ncbi:PAS domain S-box protein [Natrarchaeobaculum sulfurireducens]|uniref:Diguanylate cyclase/phosphodiesterase (GGDEF &EAL domains) with PAS/PAC sensor(S) n=1 Tax=Natrarchaeobaculum sulfurireducens TaxID=2044521 RepID=A0A346PPT0_9EURY|nr:PAS domain S-box protein [Natrarchaeobaculum sulfurireducens]AXR81525.1 diguanylate cyclase/phosphodiesterase (GGDEF &EAL domains) with PAS/PAC sensor(s) [Natrarchaeobaculum sulfurireducens]
MTNTERPGSGDSNGRDGDQLASPLAPYDEPGFFRHLAANTSEGILTIDEDSTIVFANPAIKDVLGYTPDELIGSSKMILIPPRLRDAHAAGLEAYLRTGEKHIDWDGIELPALHKDGHEIPVLVSLREHDENGDSRLFTGLFRDLSARKERERQFEAVFNNTYQFTGLTDVDGTVLEANGAALSFAGLERSEVVGKPLWESYWFQLSDRAKRVAREAVEQARTGAFFRDEVRVQGAERTAIIDFSVRPVTDQNGEAQLLIPEGRDITDLKLREQHLQVIHRLLRHNLRNDLNIVKGFAETLTEELEVDRHREYAAEIDATASRLLDASETAKTLASATFGTAHYQEETKVVPVLERVVDNFSAQNPEVTITLACINVEDPTVLADDRLETAFVELVENAAEHTVNSDPVVTLEVCDHGTDVAVHILDNGPGIPCSEQTGIFNDEPVTQIDHGSGLGLWLVALVIDDYGGSLEYRPRDGGGSRVIVVLPAREDE